MASDDYQVLRGQGFILNLLRFFGRFPLEVMQRSKSGAFPYYGVTLYCGRQGSGKTMSMVEQLEYYKQHFPSVLIYTNFGYLRQDGALSDWSQILETKNGLDGVVFAIDEIQKEWNIYDAKGFPIELLGLVTQQRKQNIKILGTAQTFGRVVKQLREQAFEVVDCRTFGGCWTFQRAFDAWEYNAVVDNPDAKERLKPLWHRNFIQSRAIRDLYDSYAVIDSMKKASLVSSKYALK